MRRFGAWGGILLAEIPGPSSKSPEIQEFEFVRTKEVSAQPGGCLSVKSLAGHQYECLDLSAGGLVSIWVGPEV